MDDIKKIEFEELLVEKLLEKNKHNFLKLGFYENYQRIIQNTKELFQELNITNPLLIAIIYEYLLWNGYFSVNHEFLYSIYRKISFDLCGAVIMTGKGVCLNIANFENDILNSLDINAYNIDCSIKDNLNLKFRPHVFDKDDHEYIDNDNEVKDSKKLLMKFLDMLANSKINILNHAIILIKCNKGYVLHDPTNHAFLNLKKDFQARYVGSPLTVNFEFNIFNNPNLSYIEFLSLKEKIKDIENLKIINLKMLELLYEQSSNIYHDNLKLFKDFYHENQSDIENVSKKLILTKK